MFKYSCTSVYVYRWFVNANYKRPWICALESVSTPFVEVGCVSWLKLFNYTAIDYRYPGAVFHTWHVQVARAGVTSSHAIRRLDRCEKSAYTCVHLITSIRPCFSDHGVFHHNSRFPSRGQIGCKDKRDTVRRWNADRVTVFNGFLYSRGRPTGNFRNYRCS